MRLSLCLPVLFALSVGCVQQPVQQRQAHQLPPLPAEELPAEKLSAEGPAASPAGVQQAAVSVADERPPVLPPPLSAQQISAGQCWVYAPIRPRPVDDTVEVVVKDSSTRISVTPAEIRQGYRQVVTREGVTTYRIVPATFKEVTEQVMVKPETPRIVVVPAVYEEREAVLTVEEPRTVLEPCRAAGTRYGQNTGAMAFCAKELPGREELVKVQVMVSPETTRVEYEPAEYKTVTRWVVDQPAQVIEVSTEPEVVDVPVKEVVTPEKTRQHREPAQTRQLTVTRYEGEPEVVARRALCDHEIKESLVRRLQQELSSRGYTPGTLDGLLGRNTIAALTDFQTGNGLAVGALTYESLEALGLSEEGF